MFVMLDDSAAWPAPAARSDREDPPLAAVARGGDAGNSKPQAIALAGNDLKPYAPVHLAASGSFGADITLSWVRRTRVGGELKGGFRTMLLAEDADLYELEILRPEDDVRRTVTGLMSPTFTYTAAMQTEDFPEGYPVSAFLFYQISAQVGRGFAGRFDFRAAPQFTTVGPSPTARPVVAPRTSLPTRSWPRWSSTTSAPYRDVATCAAGYGRARARVGHSP
jgi:hypothetical protein